ncbi:hypothetical protein [Nocardia cyriacigeorgica]|uniref:DNA-directed RNA polymerase subunit beta n=1 Tax=Nocardia cyriacigeorgica TaxID=135487 RepID=A0A5R8P6B5_9NOCA|nr:hypothetical protein [Nocardia cyriacigeorgica]TLF79596.1 hypothetical protein FEK34_09775 [Nocardia cyriacigeorgica]TLF97548.1 hypothetical protein FEK35_26950 [Nocardia cyriacigeorgica]
MTTLVDFTLENRCVSYRREFQFPAVIDPTSRRILLKMGARYGAITMPAELGEQVQQRLRLAGIAGPVVAHPRARRWTFLTGPTRPDSLSAAESAELFRLYATVASAGSHIVLPSPDDERTGYRSWVQAPESGTDRPPQSAVIEATRALGTRTISRG